MGVIVVKKVKLGSKNYNLLTKNSSRVPKGLKQYLRVYIKKRKIKF
jgi:hypothetical protein